MASIQDDRGYNQGFKPSKALSFRFERRCQRMVQEMNVNSETRILELGCGIGELSFLLAKKTGATVIGTDLCSAFIEKAQRLYQLPNLSFKKYKLDPKASEINATEKFDYIVGNGILHHVFNDLKPVLCVLKNKLKPGGKIIFWEPNIFNPYIFLIFKVKLLRKLAKLEPEEMAFGASFISAKLSQSGYAPFYVEYSDFLLPNTPEFLINLVIKFGAVLEKLPLVNRLAQSLFISAQLQNYETSSTC